MTGTAPVAQLVRFAVMGGLANGLYLGIVLLGGAGGADVQALNAVGTASSTVLANELHRRYTFRAVGRSSALAVHLPAAAPPRPASRRRPLPWPATSTSRRTGRRGEPPPWA